MAIKDWGRRLYAFFLFALDIMDRFSGLYRVL